MKILIATLAAAGMLTMFLMLFAPAANAALDDAKAQDLLKSGGCVACHSVDKKILGPAYKEVAQKRKGDKDAVATLENAVRNGSKGTYSTTMPMPPNPQSKISDADLHDLIEWVLTK